jgi:primosomal protein N' (replication factor Y)
VGTLSIAKVEPLTNARALRGPFDYRVPERLAVGGPLGPDGVGVGSVLEIPFGSQRLLGVVTAMSDSSDLPAERLAEPIRALGPSVGYELVELGLWIGREYCSTPARGLELVLPPGTGVTGRGSAPKLELRVRLTGEGLALATGEGPKLGAKQAAAVALLKENGGEAGAGELRERAGIQRATIRSLEERGLVEAGEVEVSRRPVEISVGAAGPARLNPDQRAAVERVTRALDGAGTELLLHGVTGSGKTEVYLAAAEEAMQRGRGVIILVPEIGLTPQTLARFRARFGEKVAVLHSRLSAGERRDEWERLRRGEARICVGPRSAVFAPLAGLGLIVLDEEHDSSYKQESDPRYDAREVARHRARQTGSVLVSGSATPRPESWRALPRIELPKRADGAPLPPVELLDMRGRDGRLGPLHPRAREALAELAASGGKAIILVPRRGWSPHVSCRECGHAWGCPQCDVSLVLHRDAKRLRCHHCGHAEQLPSRCPECGSSTIAQHGAGSERVAGLVEELIAPLPVMRLDSDTSTRKGAHAEILSAFERADAGVLLGTQMVAKGHDFPDVVLSLLIDADAGLRFPDLRAEERTFALVAQLAGRSGRGVAGGRVMVQTLAPEADAIAFAAAHDAPGFLEGELKRRAELMYPPFASLIRVEVSAPRPRAADAAVAQIAARLRPLLPGDARLLGPAPRFRLRGRERRQLLVKSPGRSAALDAVREAVEGAASARSLRAVQLSVDVDPV